MEMGQRVGFCPHCGVPTVKSEGCDHMLCVCGTDWTWGEDPLMVAFESWDMSRIEQLLRERSDINAPLEGSFLSPLNFFLESLHEARSETTEIVRMLAKFGATPNPEIYAIRLSYLISKADIDLFKVLLEQFRGIPTALLTEKLEEAVVAVCTLAERPLVMRMQADPREVLEQMANMLIDRGARASDAAQVLHNMSKRLQRKCPVQLAHVLKSAFEPHDMEEHFAEAKLAMDHLRCRSRLRSAQKARRFEKCLRAKLEKRSVRPRGGRCKATESHLINPPATLDCEME